MWKARNGDGTGTARVVKSYTDLGQAQAARAQQPGLALHRHTYSTPPRRGDIVSVKASDSPEVARRLRQLGNRAKGKVNGHERAALANPQAKKLELKQNHQISQSQ